MEIFICLFYLKCFAVSFTNESMRLNQFLFQQWTQVVPDLNRDDVWQYFVVLVVFHYTLIFFNKNLFFYKNVEAEIS